MPRYSGDKFIPFLFQNEDLNDLSKSSSNSWVPRLELFHDSQPGPHIFLLCRWYDASISVCLLYKSSGVRWLNCTFFIVPSKKSTVTPGQWVCINFIFNLKDLAGHMSCCAPTMLRENGFPLLVIYTIHFICCWNCATEHHCKLFHTKWFMLGGESVKYLT